MSDTESGLGRGEERAHARAAGDRPAGHPAPGTGTGARLPTSAPRPQTAPRPARRASAVLGLIWLAAVSVLAGSLVAMRAYDAPDVRQQLLAVSLGGLLTLGLGWRSGGSPLAPTILALTLGVAAVATQWAVLLGGVAVGIAVLAAVLAILGTTPAPVPHQVVREVVLAQSLATVGAVGVAGMVAPLQPTAFGYTVLALSLAAALALVHHLAGGLHGLGRAGSLVLAAAIVVLVVGLAYGEALETWGAPALIERYDAVRFGTRDLLGAVPHPLETLVGIPALAWGVHLRARRRQGWWVCAFGTAATAPATTLLVDVGITPLNTLLAAGYSIVLGLLLGYLLIRLDQSLRGARGRWTRPTEQSVAHRPEPSRLTPLP